MASDTADGRSESLETPEEVWLDEFQRSRTRAPVPNVSAAPSGNLNPNFLRNRIFRDWQVLPIFSGASRDA